MAELIGTEIRFFRGKRLLEDAEELEVLRKLHIRADHERRLAFGWMDYPSAKVLAQLIAGPVRIQDPMYVDRHGDVVMRDTPIYGTPVRRVVIEELVERGVAEKYKQTLGLAVDESRASIWLRLAEATDPLEVMLELLRRDIPVAMRALEEIELRAAKLPAAA